MKRLILALLVALGWLFINRPLKATNILYFTSAPGSWVGRGQTLTLTSPTSAFSVHSYIDGVSLRVDDQNRYYRLELGGPESTVPTIGFYPNATRFGFNGSGPGLDFSTTGRGDNTLTGYFNVLQADYDLSGNIMSFAVDFTQYDEGVKANWVSGSFRYNSNIPVPEPASAAIMTLAGLFIALKRRKRWVDNKPLLRRAGPQRFYCSALVLSR